MSDETLSARGSSVSTQSNVASAMLSQGWSLALAVVSALVLARLLQPEDFAVLAAIIPLIAIAQQLQGIGIGTAIVQAPTISYRQIDKLFWISMMLSIFLAALLALAAPLAARLLGDPRLEAALPVAALIVILTAFAYVPNSILSRNLRFRAGALRNSAANTVSTLTTIALAALYHSYWALIAGLLVLPFVHIIMACRMARWWPGLPRRGVPTDGLIRFGLNVWAAGLFNIAARRADNLIIAHATTPRLLGLYDRAYALLLFPINHAVAPLAQIMVPLLSRSADDPQRHAAYYWRGVILLLLACQPAFVIAATFSPTVIGVLLGPVWLEAAPVFAWFAVVGTVQLLDESIDWLLTSQGRGPAMMKLSLISSAIALASFAIGVRWGILGVAMTYTLGQIMLVLPLALYVAGRSGPVRHADFARRLIPIAAALALSWLAALAVRLTLGLPLWPRLIAITLGTYAIYGGTLWLFPSSRIVLKGLAKDTSDWLLRRNQPASTSTKAS